MTAELHISSELRLPVDAITETFGILAVKRAGKSNAAVVIAEEMFKAGLPWVAIDPKGDWWGMRSSGDGKGPGLPIVVFGGLHADVPLEPGAGQLVADIVVEQRLTCVVDVSEMTKAEQRRFLTPFVRRLYQRNREPLHVFAEEADEYIPQVVRGDDAEMVGVWETLVKRGGFRGLGCTLITQRSASLNNDVLTQIQTLFALRTTGVPDRKRVEEWVNYHQAGKELVQQLPTLEDGQALVFSPNFLRSVTRIRFRRRETFDSGATPKVGMKARPPAILADVDLALLRDRMAATIEKQKADDPRELRKRIQELERQVLVLQREAVTRPVIEVVERPVLVDEALIKQLDEVPGMLEVVGSAVRSIVASLRDNNEQAQHHRGPGLAQTERPASNRRDEGRLPHADKPRQAPLPAVRTIGSSPGRTKAQGSDGQVSGPEQRILDALAWLEAFGLQSGRREQVAFLAGYTPNTGTFNTYLGGLRSTFLIEYPRSGSVELTEAGRRLANRPEAKPSTAVLHAAMLDRLDGPQRRIMQPLLDAFPGSMSREELADASGYTANTGTFNTYLGGLRSLGIIDYPSKGQVAALEILFLERAA